MDSWLSAGPVSRALRGAAAGLAATAAMSSVMTASERVGVLRGQPPRLLVDRFAPALGDRGAGRAATMLHAVIGAGAGAVFAELVPRRRSPARGVLYGLVLWVIGYEGVVPALGVLPLAHRDDRGRVLTMLAAHVVFGAVLGRRAGGR
jgi:hypothetical protein